LTQTGLTDIEDIAPFVRFLVPAEGWMNRQTILINGGYTPQWFSGPETITLGMVIVSCFQAGAQR